MEHRVSLLLLDLDGTVYEDGKALPGVVECLLRLKAAGTPLRFLSNTTTKTRAVIQKNLGTMGIPAAAEEIRTAALAARDVLQAMDLHRVRALLRPEVYEDLAPLDLVAPEEPAEERPQAVLVGDLQEAWNYRMLDRAFDDLMAGSRLVACQRNRYFRSGGRLKLDAGPFVRLLEDAADREALLVGKPADSFFLGAVREALGAEAERAIQAGEVFMVGDDLENDVLGAQACGLRGIHVRTGKFLPDEEERALAGADFLVDSAADLCGVLLP